MRIRSRLSWHVIEATELPNNDPLIPRDESRSSHPWLRSNEIFLPSVAWGRRYKAEKQMPFWPWSEWRNWTGGMYCRIGAPLESSSCSSDEVPLGKRKISLPYVFVTFSLADLKYGSQNHRPTQQQHSFLRRFMLVTAIRFSLKLSCRRFRREWYDIYVLPSELITDFPLHLTAQNTVLGDAVTQITRGVAPWVGPRNQACRPRTRVPSLLPYFPEFGIHPPPSARSVETGTPDATRWRPRVCGQQRQQCLGKRVGWTSYAGYGYGSVRARTHPARTP
jgi:hypothetical protein